MKVSLSQKAGFTLTEIMVVVGIIGLLLPIAIPNFLKARANARTSTCINNLRQIDAAKQQWATETGRHVTPVASNLAPYLNRDGSVGSIFCPEDPARAFDSSYSIGDLNTRPSCLIEPETHIFD